MKGIEFMVFRPGQAEELAKSLGFEVKKGYLTLDGQTVHCQCCGQALKPDRIGNVLPGSKVVYCDNPVCFAEYVDKYLWE
jgi:hypothetical protein